MLKHILFSISLLLVLSLLTACGGGGSGGDSSSSSSTTATKAYSKAILKVDLVGTLPSGSAISGTSFALFLKSDLVPALTNGEVAAGVVTPSGFFTNGAQIAVWTPSNTSMTSGTMMITLADTSPGGVTQVGEVARITLPLTNQTAPAAGSYILAPYGVVDLAGNPIPELKAAISEVILQ
ncbi:MAG TPA: hypothetical protein VN652_07750 [Geobacteraceae bacterium]|nr:hypothetical protein [Geobacteraceae bacterium]